MKSKIAELKFVGLFDSYLVILPETERLALLANDDPTDVMGNIRRRAYVFNSVGHYGRAVINPDKNWYNVIYIPVETEVEVIRENVSLSEGERLYKDCWRHRPLFSMITER